VEKSVGIFRRAFGGWVEYGRRCLDTLEALSVVRGIEEINPLKGNLANIRILGEESYSKCLGRKKGHSHPAILVLGTVSEGGCVPFAANSRRYRTFVNPLPSLVFLSPTIVAVVMEHEKRVQDVVVARNARGVLRRADVDDVSLD
jgi:hypothetical protein